MKFLFLIFLLNSFLFSSNLKDMNVISKIPEASGICFNKKTNTLFVANDEGSIYEIDKNGNILRNKYIGDYDLEGISCNNDLLYFAVEGKDNVLIVNTNSFSIKNEISIKRKFKGIKILKKDKKHGLEGIILNNDKIFLSNQSYKKYPKKDSSVIIQVNNNIYKKKLKIKKIINHHHFDIAGLTIHSGKLYMVSDNENLLIIYDIKKSKIIEEIKIPSFSQEGVTFDDENHIYFADDNGYVIKGKIL